MAKPVFPKEILDLVTQAPVIIGESKEQYVALYVGTVGTLKPVDHADYLWLLRYADAMWELIRARKMRASFLERLMKEGARRLVESRSSKGRDFADSGYNYKQFGVNPYEGLAVSFGEAEITKLEYWDGIIDSAQRDCDTILQLWRRATICLRTAPASAGCTTAK
jgi:hypothetical protein